MAPRGRAQPAAACVRSHRVHPGRVPARVTAPGTREHRQVSTTAPTRRAGTGFESWRRTTNPNDQWRTHGGQCDDGVGPAGSLRRGEDRSGARADPARDPRRRLQWCRGHNRGLRARRSAVPLPHQIRLTDAHGEPAVSIDKSRIATWQDLPDDVFHLSQSIHEAAHGTVAMSLGLQIQSLEVAKTRENNILTGGAAIYIAADEIDPQVPAVWLQAGG